MTGIEQLKYIGRVVLDSIVVVLPIAIFLPPVLTNWLKGEESSPFEWLAALGGFVLWLAAILVARWRIKQALCNTAWAREQGYTPGKLKLDVFDKMISR
ncbi:MAG TPA: hypothetical protein PLJ47_04595, partial [Candidatus Hydrogenedentes bacterium]|nr:hypothetical protein [Candidatus Hydrogenedentota bacterium]